MGDTSVLSRFRLRAGVEVFHHFYPPGRFVLGIVLGFLFLAICMRAVQSYNSGRLTHLNNFAARTGSVSRQRSSLNRLYPMAIFLFIMQTAAPVQFYLVDLLKRSCYQGTSPPLGV